MTSQKIQTDSWYPRDFWVPDNEKDNYPLRYGDLFEAPKSDCFGRELNREITNQTTGGKVLEPWLAAIPLSPSCELGAKAKPDSLILLALVRSLAGSTPDVKAAVSTGWSYKGGVKQVAFSKLMYLAPVDYSTTHNEMMFADFTETVWVRYEELIKLKRIAALDHDARVGLIRREIYYKYRWILSIDDVREAESVRISADTAYLGPKPSWAMGSNSSPKV